MKICDYCGKPAEACTGADIYPHRPDLASKKFFRCVPCGAYVGRHADSGHALGRLANAELRAAKMRAHAAFDPLWKRGSPIWKFGRFHTRKVAYAWLASALGITKAECHIGMFDMDLCLKTEAVCLAEYPKTGKGIE